MEVPFDLGTIFDAKCVRLDSQSIKKFNIRKYPFFANIVEKMGKLSAEAQKMRRVLTSYEKLLESEDQILYLLWEPLPDNASYSRVLGFLKVGRRKLYLYEANKTACHQRRPVSVLDFYVHFTRQRQGNGKILYDAMLRGERVQPNMIAIDKPSESLLTFLTKHYGLINPIWQNTNYVVFPGFFESPDEVPEASDDSYWKLNSFGRYDNGDHDFNKGNSRPHSPVKTVTPISNVSMGSPLRASPLKSADVVDYAMPYPKQSNGNHALPSSKQSNGDHRPYGMDRVDRPYAVDPSQQQQPLKPLTIEASPPMSPSNGAASVPFEAMSVTFEAMSVTSPSQSSAQQAKERMLSALGHHKLW